MGAERSGCSRMRIGLIDVDGHNFPNIPLMKLAAWHKQHGDTVEWYEPLFSGHMDRVYMSKVFGFTEDYPYFVDADEVIRGGSGYCIELTEVSQRRFTLQRGSSFFYAFIHSHGGLLQFFCTCDR